MARFVPRRTMFLISQTRNARIAMTTNAITPDATTLAIVSIR